MDVVRAGLSDVDAAVETITRAFAHDPVWEPALAAPGGSDGHHRLFWRLCVEGALRHQTVFVSPASRTVSVWIPPGESELSTDQEQAMRDLITNTLDPERAAALFELWDRFEQNHPHDEPHAYLSLLGTRPDHAGHGLGQAHLAADLARWDAAGIPTYLESSNPVNNHRYERQGYTAVGQFRTVLDSAIVTSMWRPARTRRAAPVRDLTDT